MLHIIVDKMKSRASEIPEELVHKITLMSYELNPHPVGKIMMDAYKYKADVSINMIKNMGLLDIDFLWTTRKISILIDLDWDSRECEMEWTTRKIDDDVYMSEIYISTCNIGLCMSINIRNFRYKRDSLIDVILRRLADEWMDGCVWGIGYRDW